jgi:hypothetical protein
LMSEEFIWFCIDRMANHFLGALNYPLPSWSRTAKLPTSKLFSLRFSIWWRLIRQIRTNGNPAFNYRCF